MVAHWTRCAAGDDAGRHRARAAGIRRGGETIADAGYEWLELHAAHGYLIQEFLSPLANHRTDNYGGSFENRIRFLRETTAAVRAVWPDTLPLTVRLSCTEWVDGGWTLDESVELARLLKAEGVDLGSTASSGGGVCMVARAPSNRVFTCRFPSESAVTRASRPRSSA